MFRLVTAGGAQEIFQALGLFGFSDVFRMCRIPEGLAGHPPLRLAPWQLVLRCFSGVVAAHAGNIRFLGVCWVGSLVRMLFHH